jgi:exonuclease SbcC
LFIDEGFGSPDSDTLRIAMDALGHLQTQGRKIGIISHVTEMTERITVQIKVIKTSNGKSKIEVTG